MPILVMRGLDPRIHQKHRVVSMRWIAGSTLAAYGGSPGNDDAGRLMGCSTHPFC